MKGIADLRVFVKKCNLAIDNFDKANLEADLSDGERQIDFRRNISNKGIASAFRAKNNLYLGGFKNIILFIFLNDGKNGVAVFLLLVDDFPELRVDGSPRKCRIRLETNFKRLKFQVVRLKLQLIRQVVFEFKQKAIAG